MSDSPFSLDFPRFHSAPQCRGVIRTQPEDFRVDERLGFAPGGEGEHVYLRIQKRGENTLWVAKQLGRLAGVKLHDVGYAGLKDRQALTRQWFSVWLPGRQEPDWQALESESIQILDIGRHGRKLKRGAHQANAFRIRIRGLEDVNQIERLLCQIREQGVPNYFGEQRFGHQGGNLQQADLLLKGQIRVKDRQRRGLYLSAARAWLFNSIVAERIRRDCFDRFLPGDRLMLAGSTNLAPPGEPQPGQLETMQLHPTAPLYGRGRTLVEAEALALETDILAAWPDWCAGLEKFGLTQERRSIRLAVTDLQWSLEADSLELRFELMPGCFATSVLRECCDYRLPESA